MNTVRTLKSDFLSFTCGLSGRLHVTAKRSLLAVSFLLLQSVTPTGTPSGTLSEFLFPLASAQTDLRISGPQAGFPVAIPQLCNTGAADSMAVKLPEIISKNLDLSGIFKVLNPGTFVETPGKCNLLNGVAFSDWSVIGAEGLVKGTVTLVGSTVRAELYLYDVQQQKAVLGKRYESDVRDFNKIAHRFSNEVVKFFTGEEGIFGTQIAFSSNVGRFKEIFIMDLDGSNIRQMTRDRGLAMSPSWSPNGQSITFQSYRTRRPQLYVMPTTGGTARQVSQHPELISAPEFSKDGSSLIASASFNGYTNLVSLDLRSRALRKITSGSTIDTSPSLSPDGSQLAFTSNRGGGPQIYVIPASGGEARRVSFTGSNYCTSPAWSPKGDKIAFVCLSGGNQLFIAPTDGSKPIQMTFGGNNEDPNWAPDGRYLVFSSDFGRPGTKTLAVLPINSQQPKRIDPSRTSDISPSWSPRLN